jgi:putative copper resistance protein D
MAGFVDVLLRGAILVLASLVLGGVVWTRLILRARPGVTPAPATALALRVVAAAAALAALAQASTLLVALVELRGPEGWPIGAFVRTTFAVTALVRVTLAVAVVVGALRLARHASGRLGWHALGAGALALVVTSAVLSHAVARVEDRALLLLLDAAHQVAAAVWIGGLGHLTLYGAFRARQARPPRSVGARAASPATDAGEPAEVVGIGAADAFEPASQFDDAVVRRFSNLAIVSVWTLVAAGALLTWRYVGEWAALVGTAYGVMVLSKVVLLVVILVLAALNFRAVRRARAGGDVRLLRFVEVELGLGVTVLFAAASLTSLPPAVDVTTDRATVAEVASRFVPRRRG